MSVFDFKVRDMNGLDYDLAQFKGKVIMIVNVASKCGFTPQYEALEAMYKKYKNEGLVIIGFPCNQFLEQEPASNHEIQEFCRLTYGVSFPVMGKIDVNGENTDPLYAYIKELDPEENIDVPEDFQHYELFKKVAGGKHWGRDIPWNFTKFLFNRNGELIGRYAPTADLEHIESRIYELLGGADANS